MDCTLWYLTDRQNLVQGKSMVRNDQLTKALVVQPESSIKVVIKSAIRYNPEPAVSTCNTYNLYPFLTLSPSRPEVSNCFLAKVHRRYCHLTSYIIVQRFILYRVYKLVAGRITQSGERRVVTLVVANSGIVPQSRRFFSILRSSLLTDLFCIRRYIARANESFLKP